MVTPTKAKVKSAVDMGNNIIALEFDSEVLVNQAPVLKLANGNLANFLTQYDAKTLLFAINKEDIGQEVTELVSGAIESIHNLPVSLEGAGIPGGINDKEAAVTEIPEYTEPIGTVGEEAAPTVELPEFTGGVNDEAAPVTEISEYTEPVGTVGEEAAPTVEVPEFEGGVNAVQALVNELPEFEGGVNAVQALVHELPEFVGGVNAVQALVHELPEFVGGVNAVQALVHELPEFVGSVNSVASLKNEVPEFVSGVSTIKATKNESLEYKSEKRPVEILVVQQDKTYQAPAAQQLTLPETRSEVSTSLVSLGIVGTLLGLFGMAKKRED